MRKITLSIIAMLASAWTLDASAQLVDGFYHIKNVLTVNTAQHHMIDACSP